jgi:hypothetical protein
MGEPHNDPEVSLQKQDGEWRRRADTHRRHEKQIAAQHDPGLKAALEKALADAEESLKEFEHAVTEIRQTPPTLTYTNKLVLHRGGREIEAQGTGDFRGDIQRPGAEAPGRSLGLAAFARFLRSTGPAHALRAPQLTLNRLFTEPSRDLRPRRVFIPR